MLTYKYASDVLVEQLRAKELEGERFERELRKIERPAPQPHEATLTVVALGDAEGEHRKKLMSFAVEGKQALESLPEPLRVIVKWDQPLDRLIVAFESAPPPPGADLVPRGRFGSGPPRLVELGSCRVGR